MAKWRNVAIGAVLAIGVMGAIGYFIQEASSASGLAEDPRARSKAIDTVVRNTGLPDAIDNMAQAEILAGATSASE